MLDVVVEVALLKLSSGLGLIGKAYAPAASSIVNCFLYFDFNYLDAENVWCTMWS